jgi:hypothetical protein
MGRVMDSILQKNTTRCFICHSRSHLEFHHVFAGSNRSKSEKYGLKVRLCHFCHNEPPRGVHQNKEIRQALQSFAQKKAMEYYGWDEDAFREIFYKSYL